MQCLIVLLLAAIAYADAKVHLLQRTHLNGSVTLTCTLISEPDVFSAAAWSYSSPEYAPIMTPSMGYRTVKEYVESHSPKYTALNCTSVETNPVLCKATGWRAPDRVSSVETANTFGPVLDYRWEDFTIRNEENATFENIKSIFHLSVLTSGSFFIYVKHSALNVTYLFSLDVGEAGSPETVVSSIFSCSTHYLPPGNCSRDLQPTATTKDSIFKGGKQWQQISVQVERQSSKMVLKLINSRKSIIETTVNVESQAGRHSSENAFKIYISNPHNGKYKLHDYQVRFTRDSTPLELEMNGGWWQIVYYAQGASLLFSNPEIKNISLKTTAGWQVMNFEISNTTSTLHNVSFIPGAPRGFWAIADLQQSIHAESIRVRKLLVVNNAVAQATQCTALRSGNSATLNSCESNMSTVSTTPITRITVQPLPNTMTTVQPPCDHTQDMWFWISVSSLSVNALLILCMSVWLLVRAWQHGACRKEEEPWYRRRGSLLLKKPSPAVDLTQRFSMLLRRDQRYSEEPSKQRETSTKKGVVKPSLKEVEPMDPIYDDLDIDEAGSSSRKGNIPQIKSPNIHHRKKGAEEKSPNRRQQNKSAKKVKPPHEDTMHGNFEILNKVGILSEEVEYGNMNQNNASGFSNPNYVLPNDNPEYGNFEISVIDEPIFGKTGPKPVVIDTDDPIYGNFDAASEDPIYGNFDVINHAELGEDDPVYGNVKG